MLWSARTTARRSARAPAPRIPGMPPPNVHLTRHTVIDVENKVSMAAMRKKANSTGAVQLPRASLLPPTL